MELEVELFNIIGVDIKKNNMTHVIRNVETKEFS